MTFDQVAYGFSWLLFLGGWASVIFAWTRDTRWEDAYLHLFFAIMLLTAAFSMQVAIP